jgi:hypothetical protein
LRIRNVKGGAFSPMSASYKEIILEILFDKTSLKEEIVWQNLREKQW